MIQNARQEAVKLLHDGETAIEQKMAGRIETAKKTLVQEKEKIILEKSKDTEQVKLDAEQNFDRAIPIILDIFERSVNAETPEDE
jgi:vacuolar-type H+-ATPase subunit H